MKKITLAIIAAVGSITVALGQANISIRVPVKTNSYIDVLPGGTQNTAEFTGIFLYSASELGALTGTNVTGIGFALDDGASANAVGSCTVYMENTSDIGYLKGTSFTTATSSMTPYYTGNVTIPSTAGASTVNINFPSNFVYTGGGIYVAIKWSANNPAGLPAYNNGANSAAFPSNVNQSLGAMGAFEDAATGMALTDQMNSFPVRPCMVFKAENTATNETSVANILVMGKAARNSNEEQYIEGYVRNSSLGTLSNIDVTLTVSGANTFTDTYKILNISAGSTATVPFTYSPTAQGNTSITISIPNDQNNANNSFVRTQSVTCNVVANNPPTGTYTSALGFPATSNVSGAYWVSPFAFENPQTLTGIRISIGSSTSNAGKKVYGVLIDENEEVIAKTNTLTLTGATSGFQTFSFKPNMDENFDGIVDTELQPGTLYYIGLAQEGVGYYPMGFLRADEYFMPGNDIIIIQNSSQGGYTTYGYFGIEPILGPAVSVAEPTSTLVCKGDAITLNANGASTYTWSGNVTAASVTPSNRNDNPLVVVPNYTATSGTGTSYTYTLRGSDGFGCTNSVTIVMRVTNCTGVEEMGQNANIALYPNPAVSGKTEIHGLEGRNTIVVYNMLGQQVSKFETATEVATIDLTSQPSGNYLVKIINESSNQSKVIKFINQN